MQNQNDDMFASSKIIRRDIIRKLVDASSASVKFRFRGNNQSMPVISVRLSLPIYRVGNRRTKTLQEEYLVKHPDLPKSFFAEDVDSVAVQVAQDEILRDLIRDKDLYGVFQNPKVQQDETIICTRDGVVVNGNRRLCAWRKLFMEDPSKYAHFESIEVMVLPEDTEEPDINNIERDLQIKRAIKSEYAWHAKASMYQADLETVGSMDALADVYEMSKSDLQGAIDCYKYARNYLALIGRPGEWSLIDKHEYAFKKIISTLRGIGVKAEQKVFEACAMAMLQVQGDKVGTRRYDIIPDIAKYLHPIVDALKRDIPSSGEHCVQEDPFGIVSPSDGTSDLYRIASECSKPANLERTVKTIRDVISVADQHEQDSRTSHLLYDDLRRVSTDLISIKSRDLDDRQEELEAAALQLDSIRKTCDDITSWIKRNVH